MDILGDYAPHHSGNCRVESRPKNSLSNRECHHEVDLSMKKKKGFWIIPDSVIVILVILLLVFVLTKSTGKSIYELLTLDFGSEEPIEQTTALVEFDHVVERMNAILAMPLPSGGCYRGLQFYELGSGMEIRFVNTENGFVMKFYHQGDLLKEQEFNETAICLKESLDGPYLDLVTGREFIIPVDEEGPYAAYRATSPRITLYRPAAGHVCFVSSAVPLESLRPLCEGNA